MAVEEPEPSLGPTKAYFGPGRANKLFTSVGPGGVGEPFTSDDPGGAGEPFTPVGPESHRANDRASPAPESRLTARARDRRLPILTPSDAIK